MLLRNMPRTLYLVDNPTYIGHSATYVTLSDITANIRYFTPTIEEYRLSLIPYKLNDGERLDIVSEKLYGSPYYHWLLMIVNNRFDWLHDYPMRQSELDAYVSEKYGDMETALTTIVDIINTDTGMTHMYNETEFYTAIHMFHDKPYQQVCHVNRLTGDVTYLFTHNYVNLIGSLPLPFEIRTAYEMETELNDRKRMIGVPSVQNMNRLLEQARTIFRTIR